MTNGTKLAIAFVDEGTLPGIGIETVYDRDYGCDAGRFIPGAPTLMFPSTHLEREIAALHLPRSGQISTTDPTWSRVTIFEGSAVPTARTACELWQHVVLDEGLPWPDRSGLLAPETAQAILDYLGVPPEGLWPTPAPATTTPTLTVIPGERSDEDDEVQAA